MTMTTAKKNYLRPIDFKHGHIDMTHGAGGRAAAQLVDELFAAPLTTSICARATMAPCCRSPPVGGW
jgi:hydrogenase expression/formation protein HypE